MHYLKINYYCFKVYCKLSCTVYTVYWSIVQHLTALFSSDILRLRHIGSPLNKKFRDKTINKWE